MAKVSMGVVITGIRGRFQGVVWSAGQGGAYVRGWVRPADPKTGKQSRQRTRVTLMPGLWRGLSPAQRSDWATWAALPAQELTNSLGEPYYLSGYGQFTRINVRLLRSGLATRTDPPSSSIPAAPVIDDIVFEEVGGNPLVELQYDPAQFSASMGIMVEAANQPGGALSASYGHWRQVINGLASPTGDFDITPEWVDIFGAPGVGAQAFFRIYRQDDQGQRSAAAQLVRFYA